MQISYRLFELTNTLKVAFVPSKDDKRLAKNTITAVLILTVLYTLSFVFLKLPLMLVSVHPKISSVSLVFYSKTLLSLDYYIHKKETATNLGMHDCISDL